MHYMGISNLMSLSDWHRIGVLVDAGIVLTETHSVPLNKRILQMTALGLATVLDSQSSLVGPLFLNGIIFLRLSVRLTDRRQLFHPLAFTKPLPWSARRLSPSRLCSSLHPPLGGNFNGKSNR